jgi:hypothetical protein
MDVNPGLRGEKPVTNHLSHGTARCDSILKYATIASFQFIIHNNSTIKYYTVYLVGKTLLNNLRINQSLVVLI